jgi:hypothetical protein
MEWDSAKLSNKFGKLDEDDPVIHLCGKFVWDETSLRQRITPPKPEVRVPVGDANSRRTFETLPAGCLTATRRGKALNFGEYVRPYHC